MPRRRRQEAGGRYVIESEDRTFPTLGQALSYAQTKLALRGSTIDELTVTVIGKVEIVARVWREKKDILTLTYDD